MLQDQILNQTIFLLFVFSPYFGMIWYVIHLRKKAAVLKRNPINDYLLRSPGHTLREQLDDLVTDLLLHILMTPLISVFMYFSYKSSPKTPLSIGILLIIFLCFLGYATNKIKSVLNKMEKVKLGYDAEMAVGQELNQLMRLGFYVFHDVNLKSTVNEFNIDHIVVGKSGVFAVETKGRSKPAELTGKDSAKVTFDGQKLIFPTWEETKPVEQAKRQAQSLEKWLSSAIGESVYAKAIIALPGWYTTTVKKSSITVINGKNPEKAFLKNGEDVLTEKQICQIVHQLNNLCRDVEPKAFSIPK